MPPILETVSLHKNFDGVIAADNINVKIAEGEIIGIIGANGAGKTTFVNMITGYLKPSEGKILYKGENITGLAPRIITKKGINRSFQIPQLFEDLTVLENIITAQTIKDRDFVNIFKSFKNKGKIKNAEDILNKFNLLNYANETVAILPQGVKKLLDIAMAVIGNPELLLLDEPTSGVAIEEKFDLMNIVMEGVKLTGASILFIEHDMEIIEKYTKRVIAFYDGKIIANGETEEVMKNEDVKKYVIGFDITKQEN